MAQALYQSHAVSAALEEQFPGFKACFGGEELRRTQAAMSCLLVGGTIQALVPTDMPPSLDRQASLMRPQSADGAGSNSMNVRRSISMPAKQNATASRTEPETPTGTRYTFSAVSETPQQTGVVELEHMAQTYQDELELLGAGNVQEKGSEQSNQGQRQLARSISQMHSAAADTEHSSPHSKQASVYEAAYGLGLVLQDLAARNAVGSPAYMQKLKEACEKYSVAVKVRPNAHSALYNWGVALSDLARAIRQTDAASAKLCLEAAAARYAQALAAKPDTPQALNNWGLVLQELSGLARSKQERDQLLLDACHKFRQAIRVRPDFDRACYNLGTVCYAAACLLQGELAQPTLGASSGGGAVAPLQGGGLGSATSSSGGALSATLTAQMRQAKEIEVRNLFTCAAQYICLAYALQQHKDIYRKSLGVVRKLLPLPFLRAGYLMVPTPNTAGTPEEAWRQDWYVLDAGSLRSATSMEGSLTSGVTLPHAAMLPSDSSAASTVIIPLLQISSVHRLRDPSLPQGAAFCVVLQGAEYQSGKEICMVAEDDESAEVWVDVLLMAIHTVRSRSTEILMEALLPTSPRHSLTG